MGAGHFSEREISVTFPDGVNDEFRTGVFTIVAVAEPGYDLNLEDLFDEDTQFSIEAFQWVQRLNDLHQGVLQATNGQMGVRVYLSDQGCGLGQAELILHEADNSPAYATFGGFGRFGQAVHLFGQFATDRHTMVHEFGHHAWALGDEYTKPVLTFAINTDFEHEPNTDPSVINSTVPLLDPTNIPDDIVGSRAILSFGETLERIEVSAFDPALETLTVVNPFSQDPRTAPQPFVFIQRILGAGCSGDLGARFSIMESDDNSPNKVEFCVEANHDLNQQTSHTALYLDPDLPAAGQDTSCWRVISDVMQNRFEYPVEPVEPGTNWNGIPAEVEILKLAKEARVALVMDRSGSMATNNKIQSARFGVEYWLESLARNDEDFLSLSWFNEEIHQQLALDQYNVDDEIADIVSAMDDVDPDGNTNIRDALVTARESIVSRPDRAAMQAVVLLTDGIHNRPLGTEATEVIDSFQEAGVQIICVALGGPESVDYETLEKLADDTGGTVIRVEGDNQAIVDGLMQAEGVLRNGLAEASDAQVAPSPKEVLSIARKGKLPRFVDFVRASGFVSAEALLQNPPEGVTVIPFHVEKGASRAKISLAYPQGQKLWAYLVSPEGSLIDFTTDGYTLINPDAPFTSAMIDSPAAGVWKAVVWGAQGNAPITTNYVVTVENPSVVVTGGCTTEVGVGSVLYLSAAATYADRLSGIHVRAEITAPNGTTYTVPMNDNSGHEFGDGDYQGLFVPEYAGSHKVRIRINSTGSATRAGAIHRAIHMGDKGPAKMSIAAKAPAFRRVIQTYFDAGTRPEPKDRDPARRTKRRKQPTATRLDWRAFRKKSKQISKKRS